ncbi:uncharacterized protein LOC105851033 isoform X1 [Hydra vulgaris]|uniref:uncharacterized protein LOC105851033 isoform X1 n=1 Tax=Hydra vulgaris TaxID=6087 RepID=UPI001F5FE39F|nr:uncharacterized protein LOC105851033 [Hydra vulgaris]
MIKAMVISFILVTLTMILIEAKSVISDQSKDSLFTNPLNEKLVSKCEKKSCTEAIRKFNSLTEDLIMDRYHLVLVHRLKCLLVLRLTKHDSTSNDSACSYHTTEGFIKSPDVKLLTSDFAALRLYENLLDKILGELYIVMKLEANIDSGQNFLVSMLQLCNSVKSLYMRIKSIVEIYSECNCETFEKTKELYIQTYDVLTKKYDHSKSMLIILKQLEILKKIFKEDFWERKKKYVLCDT